MEFDSPAEQIKIIKLISKVRLINREYEISKKHSGESFNIFSILGLGTSEVRLHSALLGELLNPHGSHQHGEIFLSLFLKSIGIDDFTQDLRSCKIDIEYSVKAVNEDYTEGGRVDVIFSSSCGKKIVVENKIYARDQKNQLLRYRNAFPEAIILYLTLDGSEPSVEGKGTLLSKEYKTISYKTEILSWLEQCR